MLWDNHSKYLCLTPSNFDSDCFVVIPQPACIHCTHWMVSRCGLCSPDALHDDFPPRSCPPSGVALYTPWNGHQSVRTDCACGALRFLLNFKTVVVGPGLPVDLLWRSSASEISG